MRDQPFSKNQTQQLDSKSKRYPPATPPVLPHVEWWTYKISRSGRLLIRNFQLKSAEFIQEVRILCRRRMMAAEKRCKRQFIWWTCATERRVRPRFLWQSLVCIYKLASVIRILPLFSLLSDQTIAYSTSQKVYETSPGSQTRLTAHHPNPGFEENKRRHNMGIQTVAEARHRQDSFSCMICVQD